MRSIKVITIIIVAGILSACDDSIVIDIVPEADGYLWVVVNYDEVPPGHTFESEIAKYDLSTQKWLSFYDTPFVRSMTYDMACGNGRAWVYGGYWDNESEWYNFKLWEIGTPDYESLGGGGKGLAFDGSHIWFASSLGEETDFYKKHPDTLETELEFIYTNPRGGGVVGLAWANNTIWALFATLTGYNSNCEFIQFDPETGEVLDSFGCIAKEPRGLAWDGEALWTSDYDSQCLYRIDPKTREVLATFNPAPISENNPDTSLYIWGLAFGDGPPDPE